MRYDNYQQAPFRYLVRHDDDAPIWKYIGPYLWILWWIQEEKTAEAAMTSNYTRFHVIPCDHSDLLANFNYDLTNDEH